VPVFRRALDQLIHAVHNSEIVPTFAAGACLLVREGRRRELPKLQALCEKVHDWSARPQLLRNIVRAMDEGQISTSQQMIAYLQRIGAHGALESARVASQPTAVTSASTAFHDFTNDGLGDLTPVFKAEQNLLEWRHIAIGSLRMRFRLQGIGRLGHHKP
jgi:hypothetical protein